MSYTGVFCSSKRKEKLKRIDLSRNALPLSPDEMLEATPDGNSSVEKKSLTNSADIQAFENNAMARGSTQQEEHKKYDEGPSIENTKDLHEYICKHLMTDKVQNQKGRFDQSLLGVQVDGRFGNRKVSSFFNISP